MWRPRCEEHGIQCCRHPPCWFLKTAYCSHDSSCCADQNSLLSVSRPRQRPVTHGCISLLTFAPGRRARTRSPNGRISFLCFCPRIFSCGVIRVSLLTLYLGRIHAACLIVHGSIGECVVSGKDGIFVFHHCQICSSKSTICGDGFLRCSIALMALCR